MKNEKPDDGIRPRRKRKSADGERREIVLKGMSAALEGQSSTTVKGASVSINGTTGFSPS